MLALVEMDPAFIGTRSGKAARRRLARRTRPRRRGVLVRLGMMSGLAWVALKVLGPERRGLAIGLGLVVSSLLFGALHLPAAFQIFAPSALMVARTLFINFALAVPFGLLFGRYGLVVAMIGHFAADFVLHVALPLVQG